MAIGFPNPDKNFKIKPAEEEKNLNDHFKKRGVPKSKANRLLLASWNIANLGHHKRDANALQLLAHILKRFDLIAVQEVNEKFDHFLQIVQSMNGFDYVMTDTAGNSERLAFVYRTSKVKLNNLFGEIALRPREYPKQNVRVRYRKNRKWTSKLYKNIRYQPFDRNPYIGSFRAGSLDFTLANVHLYYGAKQNSSKKSEHMKFARRVLEILALAKWADRRKKKTSTYDQDIMLLGDMNIPVMDTKDSAFKALTKYGMQAVKHSSKTGGTNITNDKAYDQIAMAPGRMDGLVLATDIFDFDNGVFRKLWDSKFQALYDTNKTGQRKATSGFNKYVKFHLSDHRPIWVELDIS